MLQARSGATSRASQGQIPDITRWGHARAAWCLTLFVLLLLTSTSCSKDPNLCQSEQECFLGESCVQNICVLQSTSPGKDAEMPVDADMGEEMGLAGEACSTSQVCAPGLRCDLEQGRCVEEVVVEPAPTCTFEDPCDDPATSCIDGTCVERRCEQDEACGFARVCTEEGLCEATTWNLNVTDAMGNAMPGELILTSLSSTQTMISYGSDELRVFSNTSATQSASLAMTGVQSPDGMLPLEDGSCTSNITLCQAQVGQADRVCQPLDLVEIADDSLRWSLRDAPLSGGEHAFDLLVEIDCIDPMSLLTLREVLQQASVKLSLEYRRLPDEVVKGFVLSVFFKE